MTVRGPDAFGLWQDPHGAVTLGHRRLSIRDLSTAGAQPLIDQATGVVLVYNGELYGCAPLVERLERAGVTLHSTSDTEILLRLYLLEGPSFFEHLRGMAAYVIWDPRTRALHVGRDVHGIKPLYMAETEEGIWFASQVRPLTHVAGVDTAPDPAGHVGFFQWGHVPDPFTLYRGIRAVRCGAHGVFDSTGRVTWHHRASLTERLHVPAAPWHAEALRETIAESVQAHLVSDVPVGVFLSAGLDSTMLAAHAREAGGELRTLTLGFAPFRGGPHDEVPLAEAHAQALGAQHETVWVDRQDMAHRLDEFLGAMDQPTLDGANSWLVCDVAAKAGLRVALSGLGGDELFGGYPSFRDVPRWARWLRPTRAVPGLGRAARYALRPWIGRVASPKLAGLLEYGGSWPGAYLLKRALYLPHELTALLDPDVVRDGLQALDTQAALQRTVAGLGSDRSRIAALELSWYMRHQLLRDTDWAGMAHSVEVRVPLVDLAMLKVLAGALNHKSPPSKRDMARTARPALADALMNRPKSGFGVPLRAWFLDGAGETTPEPGLRGWARWVHSQLAPSHHDVVCRAAPRLPSAG